MSKIVPNLWYTDKAEAAAAFYVSLLRDRKLTASPHCLPIPPAGRPVR
jgi:predicted 3-demethylubiquinone-9 3-methyltransferase (glyoxalase superfamily)